MDIFDIKNSAQISDIANKISCEFLYLVDTQKDWFCVAINGGVYARMNNGSKHPGIQSYMSSTTANSGRRVVTNADVIALGGGEKTTFIFKTPTVQTSITRRMGFHNTVDSVTPTDGMFLYITDALLYGICKNNGATTTSVTPFTLSNDTWYRGKIEMSKDLSKATFTLYADDSDTVLWTDTITTNIPIGRTLGHGDVATSSGTTAITLGHIDYMDIVFPNARRVV